MQKRVLLMCILLLAITVNAANVTLTPKAVYEASEQALTLDMNNYKGPSAVTKFEILTPGLELTDAENYTGWTLTKELNRAEWSQGFIPTNVKSALFELKIKTSNVTENSTVSLPITINSQTTSVQLTILNDDTPPELSSLTPTGFIRAAAQTVTANLTDHETGVTSATYSVNDCSNQTPITTDLVKTGDSFTGQINFSSYSEGQKACYILKAKNNAGEESTFTGELIVDGTPPEITLLFPSGYITEETTFTFRASDNLAENLTCTLSFDSEQLQNLILPNASTANSTQNLNPFSEGPKTWSVSCTDAVGLSTTKTESVVLDKQAPQVQLSNFTMRRTRATGFNAQVTDTIGLTDVSAEFKNVMVTLAQNSGTYSGTLLSDTLGTDSLLIVAKDNAGHTTVKNIAVTTVPNHDLTINTQNVNPGQTATVQGKVLQDGASTATKVLLRTPAGNIDANLSNDTKEFSASFTAPAIGTYNLTVEFTENGHLYTKQGTLTVVAAQVSGSGTPIEGSHGPGFSALRKTGGVAKTGTTTSEAEQKETQAPKTELDSVKTPTTSNTKDPLTYVPLSPETPRQAMTSKATGIFSLGDNINWLAPLLALALLGGLGAYAYRRKPPMEEEGKMDWERYFD